MGRESRQRTNARERVHDAIDGYVYRRASVVVTTTGTASRAPIERYGVSPWQVTIQQQADRDGRCDSTDRLAARERLSLPVGAFVACYVNARVTPAENMRVLLEAWSDFIDTHTLGKDARAARLLIASAGEVRGALNANAVPAALAGWVSVLGTIDADALSDVLCAADVNIATSASAQADAVTLDAAAHGTCSIVPDHRPAERVGDAADNGRAPR